MHSTEPQATSARWRALAHSHLRALTANFEDIALTDIVDNIAKGVANILAASGYGAVDAKMEQVRHRFEGKMRHLAHTAYKISLIVREGTMSTDFQPLFIEHSREFDQENMENVYAGYGSSRGTVFCTTELGLRCYTHRDDDPTNDKRAIDKLVVLKPRVVLNSVIQIIENE